MIGLIGVAFFGDGHYRRRERGFEGEDGLGLLRSVGVPRFGQFIAGETAGFPPSIAAALVAQKDAKWAVGGEFESRNVLVRTALNVINLVAESLGRRKTNAQEVGLQEAEVAA